MIVSFTGHREVDEPVAKRSIGEVLDRLEPEWAIVGGAAGADTLAAEVCWHLKIPYEMALPHKDYPAHYKLEESKRWWRTFLRAERVIHVMDGEKPFHFSANFKRNEYMVDESDVLVSISTFDPHGEIPAKGGTAHCVRYARKVGRPIEWART